MPDPIAQLRNAAEADLESLLRKLNRQARKAVLAAIERYGTAEAIPNAFWEALKREVDEEASAVLLALLVGISAVESGRVARSHSVNQGLLPSDDLRRRDLAGPASQLGRDLASGYVDGARKRVVRIVDAEDTATMKRRSIADIFDDEQIETTTSTQTTRGVTLGQQSGADQAGRAGGLTMVAVWVTERDAKVCPICRPLHGKKQSEWEAVTQAAGNFDALDWVGQGPPAHPRCRCEIRHVADTSNN